MVKPGMIAGLVMLAALGQPCARAFSRGASQAATPDPGGSADRVWVTRADGAQSCSPKSGQSLEDGEGELKRARVRVLDSRKGNDGKMHAQLCGLPAGKTNAYLIPKDDLPQAVALGFIRAN